MTVWCVASRRSRRDSGNMSEPSGPGYLSIDRSRESALEKNVVVPEHTNCSGNKRERETPKKSCDKGQQRLERAVARNASTPGRECVGVRAPGSLFHAVVDDRPRRHLRDADGNFGSDRDLGALFQ